MSVLAAGSSSALIPSVIAAIASIICAVILAWVALRAQSAREQLAAIEKIVDEELRQQLDPRVRGLIIGNIVKRVLREVLNEYGIRPPGRRQYDDENGD